MRDPESSSRIALCLPQMLAMMIAYLGSGEKLLLLPVV